MLAKAKRIGSFVRVLYAIAKDNLTVQSSIFRVASSNIIDYPRLGTISCQNITNRNKPKLYFLRSRFSLFYWGVGFPIWKPRIFILPLQKAVNYEID